MTTEPSTLLQTRLKKRMDERGVKPAPFALSLGFSDSFVRDILRGKTRDPGAEALSRIADALETTSDYLMGRSEDPAPEPRILVVPITGKAGAGPEGAVLFSLTDGELGEAEAPINATKDTRALEVEGTSMRGIADDGSLIFYDAAEPPNTSHAGELCICWLEDGRVLVKYPYPTKDGLWSLESTTATTLRDIAVRALAHVISVVPRYSARKLIRRRPDITPVDTIISR